MNRLRSLMLRQLGIVFSAWVLVGGSHTSAQDPAVNSAARGKPDWPVLRFSEGGEQGNPKGPEEFLDRKCDIVIRDMTLGKLAEFLSNLGGVPVVLDAVSLESINITRDNKVSLEVKKTTLRAALNRLLRSLDPTLTCDIQDEMLEITIREAVVEHLTSELYKVGDLTHDTGPPAAILHGYHQSLLPRTWGPTDLADLLAKIVDPPSWDAEGGPGAIRPIGDDLLLICNTRNAHQQISEMLAGLRDVRDRHAARGNDSLAPRWLKPRADREFEARVRKALSQRVKLCFDGTRLEDVLAHISKISGLSVQLDKSALESIAITPESPVTVDVANVSLKSALRLLLRQIDPTLTWSCQDECLMITTKEASQEHMDCVLYPLYDLIAARPAGGPAPLSLDAISEAITGSVDPPSWDSEGGPGSVIAVPNCRCLAITQTADTHERIEELLGQVRKLRPARADHGGGGGKNHGTDPSTNTRTAPAADFQPSAPDGTQVVIYHLNRGVSVAALKWLGVTGPPPTNKDLDELTTSIVEYVGKAAWPAERTSIRCIGDQLIVRQSPENQQRIHALLNELKVLQPASVSPSKPPKMDADPFAGGVPPVLG